MNINRLIVACTFLSITAIAVAQSPPPPPPPSPPGLVAPAPEGEKLLPTKAGTITGRVLGDDGQPYPGVAVNINSNSDENRTSRGAVADEEGNFKFSDVPVGLYSIFARAPGLVYAGGGNNGRVRIGDAVTITLSKGGVITGKVTNATGEPMVGGFVIAMRVGDEEGKPLPGGFGGRPAMTDDRGIYRLYSLLPGNYLVSAARSTPFSGSRTDNELPTYYPAATRDTAQEITVQAGAEMSAIDIHHREENGHSVSGVVSGVLETDSRNGISLSVLSAASKAIVSNSFMQPNTPGNSFAIYGLPDGEYELRASFTNFDNTAGLNSARSAPQKIVVRGADVSGVNLKMIPLGSIKGHVTLEKFSDSQKTCKITRQGFFAETLVSPVNTDPEHPIPPGFVFGYGSRAPNEKGELLFPAPEAGNYRFTLQLPSDHWYAKAISLPNKTSPRAASFDVAHQGLNVKVSENVSGLVITLSEGAAAIQGTLASEEGEKVSAKMRVHLVPAEPQAADNVLRFYEVISRDGKYNFKHVAPGKYWIFAEPLTAAEANERSLRPLAWETNARANLRRQAEAANAPIELLPCQRVQHTVK